MANVSYALIYGNNLCAKQGFVRETYILNGRQQLQESLELKHISGKKWNILNMPIVQK